MVRELPFRGKRVKFRAQHYVCPVCRMKADDLGLAAANQKALSDAYRAAEGLLTGKQIIGGRKKLKLSQEELARAAHVGSVSIKRWDTGQIQTRAMDDVLRNALSGKTICADPTSFAGGASHLLSSPIGMREPHRRA
jgi:putative zinc finger/helix-turn-helix YgiT family protein